MDEKDQVQLLHKFDLRNRPILLLLLSLEQINPFIWNNFALKVWGAIPANIQLDVILQNGDLIL